MEDIINQLRENRLRAYKESPGDIKEHFGIEQGALAGGYGYRQVLELVQNGADAILEAYSTGDNLDNRSRIEVVLEGTHLYVANTGAPFSEEGIDALLRSHSSTKRGIQIGRFGLGFKSLLRLGGRIDITSGQIAFRFDPEKCREELRKQFNVSDVPGLRLAWSVDEYHAATLRKRFPWATTVVCAEIKAGDFLDHLQSEIREFPAEFLLFLPVAINLSLDSGGSVNSKRELYREHIGPDVILHEGNAQSRWRVVEKPVRITEQRAKDDATHIHSRDEVPLAWGMPLEGKREEAGRFWAFFPTHTPTYLPGILNAPWKLNSDRNAIISGEWNTALMMEAANLIAHTLPQFRTDADPGSILDAFPRQIERKDEDAAPLLEALWKQLETAVVIPDITGALRPAHELWRHPRDSADLAYQWQLLADAEKFNQLVHPSCLDRQRSSRLKALADRFMLNDKSNQSSPNLQQIDVDKWFSIVASVEKEKALRTLTLAEAYEKDSRNYEWIQIRSTLTIIPSDEGRLLTADQVVFALEGMQIPDGRHPVARWLQDDDDLKKILENTLAVKHLNDEVWYEVLESNLLYYFSMDDKKWQKFWMLLRSAPENVHTQFVDRNSYRIRVRRHDGDWVQAEDVFLPGGLISVDDDSPNRMFLVDEIVHAEDMDLLKMLGVGDFPNKLVSVSKFELMDEWLGEWLDYWRKYYVSEVDARARISKLAPLDLEFPEYWQFLPVLTGEPNSKLTSYFLEVINSNEFSDHISFGHSTRRDRYEEITVPNPALWFLLLYGTFDLGGETIPLIAIMARFHEPALSMIEGWKELQLKLERLNGVLPSVSASETDIRAMWQVLIGAFATPTSLMNSSMYTLWSGAARDNVFPQFVPAIGGVVPLTQVFVTGSPDLARRAFAQGHVTVALDAMALELWLENGARNLAELMNPKWTEYSGPPELLIDAIPELTDVLLNEIHQTARCQPVAELNLLVAGVSSAIPCLMWEGVLIIDKEQLTSLSRAERLQCLIIEAAAAGWLALSVSEALDILGDSKVDERREYVAQGATLADRLLRAVGNRARPLLRALGELGEADFLHGIEPHQLSELVLAQLGPATLTRLKDILEEEGLKPPSHWNTDKARLFVAAIGFPEEFASSPSEQRESEEFITGPIELPPLHDFQEEVLKGIETLITNNMGRRRAVVSLPTGGGKTRVTVEAAVRLVLAPINNQRSVIWVAQTDELCEQAVQAFRQVWVNLGAQHTDLRIVRLWGGNSNPAIQEANKPVVIVASIQTLNSRMGNGRMAWLQNPGLVVVDECHHAITPSYTNLLRFLNAEAPRAGTAAKNEPPILGLSATPFRTDDDESRRLARRFDNHWLPGNQSDLHARLLSQGVLAEVKNEALDSGVGLTSEELGRLSQFKESWEGIDFENLIESINQRLAGSKERNEKLIERITLADEQSILVFANSVLHAEELAARLNLQGISAAAISGSTPATARRYFLNRFQSGKIRVICNHTVLSTGFDAPKTDMVLISRAVFSPVRYMQMVGRGLRGEKNGGTASCKIVTVLDNLGRFQEKHPYHYWERFFLHK